MGQNKDFFLRENFYTLLLGGSIPRQEVENCMALYQICLKGPFYLVSVLHISRNSLQTERDPILAALSVMKSAESRLDPGYCAHLGLYLGDILVISEIGDRERELSAFTLSLDDFCRAAQRDCSLRLTAGVGSLCDRVCDLRESYQSALDALSYRAIYGDGRAIRIEEMGPKLQLCEFWEETALQDVLRSVRTGEKEALEKQITQLLSRFSEEGISLQGYRIFVLELIAEIFRFGISNRVPVEKIFEREGDPTELAFRLDSPEKLWDWLFRVSDGIREFLAQRRQNSTSVFVAKAIEYVKDNYSDQKISIEAICGQLGLSPAYFSTVFKRETGKTFISYLTDFRLERAAELLLTTDDKIYIIAEKAGYSDPNYFSSVFKKKFKMSPSEYRNLL